MRDLLIIVICTIVFGCGERMYQRELENQTTQRIHLLKKGIMKFEYNTVDTTIVYNGTYSRYDDEVWMELDSELGRRKYQPEEVCINQLKCKSESETRTLTIEFYSTSNLWVMSPTSIVYLNNNGDTLGIVTEVIGSVTLRDLEEEVILDFVTPYYLNQKLKIRLEQIGEYVLKLGFVEVTMEMYEMTTRGCNHIVQGPMMNAQIMKKNETEFINIFRQEEFQFKRIK